jgi:hypothetical protein
MKICTAKREQKQAVSTALCKLSITDYSKAEKRVAKTTFRKQSPTSSMPLILRLTAKLQHENISSEGVGCLFQAQRDNSVYWEQSAS